MHLLFTALLATAMTANTLAFCPAFSSVLPRARNLATSRACWDHHKEVLSRRRPRGGIQLAAQMNDKDMQLQEAFEEAERKSNPVRAVRQQLYILLGLLALSYIAVLLGANQGGIKDLQPIADSLPLLGRFARLPWDQANCLP